MLINKEYKLRINNNNYINNFWIVKKILYVHQKMIYIQKVNLLLTFHKEKVMRL